MTTPSSNATRVMFSGLKGATFEAPAIGQMALHVSHNIHGLAH